MDDNNITGTLEFKFNYDTPDKNGRVYTKEAIKKAIKNLDDSSRTVPLYKLQVMSIKNELIGDIFSIESVYDDEVNKEIVVKFNCEYYNVELENIDEVFEQKINGINGIEDKFDNKPQKKEIVKRFNFWKVLFR